jgi:branched-chain amino acid aminotransferase
MSESNAHVLVNGHLHAADRPVLRADDRGFLYGDGAFETLLVRAGAPLAWRRHMDRLQHTLNALAIPATTTELARDAHRLLEANGLRHGEAILRIAISRGPGGGPNPPATPTPTVVMRASPVGEGVHARRRGVSAISWRSGARTLPSHKTLAYLPSIMAVHACAPAEPIFVTADGRVLEGATCNLFLVRDGALFTPPADGTLLAGIARQIVLETALNLGLAVHEQPIRVEAVAAGEAFITNAVLTLAPLRRFDDHVLPPPSQLQQTLIAEYQRVADA